MKHSNPFIALFRSGLFEVKTILTSSDYFWHHISCLSIIMTFSDHFGDFSSFETMFGVFGIVFDIFGAMFGVFDIFGVF